MVVGSCAIEPLPLLVSWSAATTSLRPMQRTFKGSSIEQQAKGGDGRTDGRADNWSAYYGGQRGRLPSDKDAQDVWTFVGPSTSTDPITRNSLRILGTYILSGG